MEQFQNHPIGIPKLMKMHLKTFEHPRTPCFREYSPPPEAPIILPDSFPQGYCIQRSFFNLKQTAKMSL